MNVSVEQAVSVALCVLAGEILYVKVVNRWLILMRDSRPKGFIIAAGVALVAAAAFFAGYLLPPWPAALVLALLGIMELHRLRLRRACRGSWPVGPRPHQTELARPFTTTDFKVHRYQISLPGWHGEPFRIVHLTDFHVHRKIPEDYYRRVMRAARDERPDLAFFTGDYAARHQLDRFRAILEPVGSAGNFAVLGNHDYWDHPNQVRIALADAGFKVLTNESRNITIKGQELRLTGYDYPWGTQRKTIAPEPAGPPHLVLTHTPDNIYRLAKAHPDCVFAGHYHAGQIRLPFWGSVVIPSVYGRRFDHGHFLVNGVHLFVPSGIGVANPVFRIYCEPDFFVVDVQNGPGK